MPTKIPQKPPDSRLLEHYQRVMSAAGYALFTTDKQGVFTFASPSVFDLSGYHVDEVLGKKYTDFIAPDWREQIQTSYAAQYRERRSESTLQFPIITASGETRWIEQTVILMEDTQNDILVHSIAHDVTERKQTEDALVAERNLLQTLMESIPDMIYFKDKDSHFIRVNRAQTEVMGISSPEEAVGKSDFDFQPPHLAEQFYAEEQNIITTGQPIVDRVEYNPTPDGRSRWFSATKAPLRDAQGNIIGIVGISRDVTARKIAEESLREGEERYRLLIDTMADGVILQTADGAVLMMNRSAERILGVTADQIGASASRDRRWQLIREDGSPLPHEEQPSSITLRTGQPQSNVVIGIRKADKSIVWISVNTQPMIRTGEVQPYAVVMSFTDVTQHKRTEQALKESQEQYRLLFEKIDDAIFVHDVEANILDVNEAACRRLGYTRDELLRMKTIDIDEHDYGSKFRERLHEQLEHGKLSDIHGVHLARDGQRIYVEVNSTKITYHGQTAVLAVCRDVTQRKKTEEALQQSEAKYRRIVETASEGIWTMDTDSRITFVNKRMAQMLGYTVEEMLGQPTYAFMDQEGRAVAARNVARWHGGVGAEHDFKLKHKEGGDVWVIMYTTPLQNPDSSFAGALTMVSDITQRKQMEKALQASEARYRAIVEDQTELICRFLPDTRLTFVNEAYCRYLGKTREAMIGQPFMPLIPDAEREEMRQYLATLNQANPVGTIEHQVILPDGARRWQQWTDRVITDADGQLIEYQSVGRDITERKQAEEALRASQLEYQDLFLKAHRQARELELIDKVRTAMARELDLSAVLHTVVEATSEVFGYSHVCLYLLRGEMLVLQHVVGYERVIPEFPITLGVAGRVVRTGKPVLIKDARRDPDFLFAEEGISAEICVPLFDHGQVAGVFIVETAQEGALTDTDLQLLIAVGEHLNIAIERARLYSEVRESEAKSRALLNAIPDMMIRHDRAGRFLEVKLAVDFEMIMPPDQILGKGLHEVLPADFADLTLKRIEQVITSGEILVYEYRLFEQGEWRDYESRMVKSGPDEVLTITRHITERKAAEEALRRSERRNRAMLDAVPDLIFHLSRRGEVLDYKYSDPRDLYVEPQIGTYLKDTLPADYAALVMSYIQKALETRQMQRYEYQLELPQGGLQDFEARMVAAGSDEVITIIRNITERKAAEEALRLSESRNRALLDAIPDLMFVLDKTGRYVEFKPDADQPFPIPPYQFVGNKIDEIGLPQHVVDISMDHIQKALQTGAIQKFNYNMQYPDGMRFFDARGVALNSEEVMIIVRDTTDLKRAEEELQARYEQLSLLRQVDIEISDKLKVEYVLDIALDAAVRLSHADAGYIAISEDGRWTLAKSLGAYNEKIINAALNDGKGIVGRVIRDQQAEFVPDLASDPDYQIIIPNLQAKMVIPLLSRERGVIGILNLDTAYPDHFTTQGFEFLKLLTTRIGVAVDNAYLYHKTEEQLLEMQRLYEQVRSLEQIKTDMIRIASHDLRNPLSTIRGYLELLRNELAAKNAESELDYVRSIQDSAQRMSNIISDILSLERIEEAALEKQPFDLRELVRQTHGEHTPQANLKSISLLLDIPDAPVQVLGDSVQIHEALANLISNAIKYTPEGGTIQVRLALNDRQAVVEVEDSGYGIPEEMQARLFQPFYRARSKETRHIEGTGLGLHLVKNIIERHSGKMIFHSVYHQGSTFGFELPLLPA